MFPNGGLHKDLPDLVATLLDTTVEFEGFLDNVTRVEVEATESEAS